MTSATNALGQPIGDPVLDWQAALRPPRTSMTGRHCRVEPLDVDRHGADLFTAFLEDKDDRNWTYLPYGPFSTEAELECWMTEACRGDDPLFHAVVDPATEKAVGVASYLRIEPTIGVIETGHIHYSPLLQRRPAATEAMVLNDAPGFFRARLSPL